MIPPFDEHGLLPPGEWPCTLADIEDRLCWNPHRSQMLTGLRQFLATEWRYPGKIYVDGSFVRSKPLPADMDVVIDLTDEAASATTALAQAMLICLQRERLRRVYTVDIWVRHPQLPRDLVAFFQYLGTKAEAELRLPAKHPKGILRITL